MIYLGSLSKRYAISAQPLNLFGRDDQHPSGSKTARMTSTFRLIKVLCDE